MNKGRIVQVMGPVVDVLFEDEIFRLSKMPLKLKMEIRSVLWKLHSISETTKYVA